MRIFAPVALRHIGLIWARGPEWRRGLALGRALEG